ncbi:hypothetical protein KSP39_PZI011505 [Platanthera zijinensis]|uniref:Uncharacterized protein n=1 Tax=Platanthera zijinensis TaxID=2320716 RepID=A0AAP0BHR6_9ASPA
MSKDVSAVFVRAVCNLFSPFGVMALALRYNVSRLSTLVRIGGGGYKTLGSLHQSSCSRTVLRLKSMQLKTLLTQNSGKIELWLGRGRPLSPYLKRKLWFSLLEKRRETLKGMGMIT